MKTTTRRLTTALAAPAALLFALTACGGAERPSVDEIATSIENGGARDLMGLPDSLELSEEAYTCIAQVIHDSDLENGTVAALVEGDEDAKGSEEEIEKVSGLANDVQTECADSITESVSGG